jgi:LysR family transcriptional regulator, regulatory protein for tcuABC
VEIRALRSFVRVVEVGSISRAALDLNMVQSALSRHISSLESELSTRLLHRSPHGVVPTEAGLAFFREVQLALRHLQQASREAQQARLRGTVSVGFAPTTATLVGLPFFLAMRERYPQVMVHLVEALSGHLSTMLDSRQLDMAILFRDRVEGRPVRRWQMENLLEEDLFYIVSRQHGTGPLPESMRVAQLRGRPLILPSGPHGLRHTLDALFERARFRPTVTGEIDSLNMLIDAIRHGIAGTLQPWGFLEKIECRQEQFQWTRISDRGFKRHNLICSLSDAEMSPPALAARVVLREVSRELVASGRWAGARVLPDPAVGPV